MIQESYVNAELEKQPCALVITTNRAASADLRKARKVSPPQDKCLACGARMALTKKGNGVRLGSITTVERLAIPLLSQPKVAVIKGLVCEHCTESLSLDRMIAEFLIGVGFITSVDSLAGGDSNVH